MNFFAIGEKGSAEFDIQLTVENLLSTINHYHAAFINAKRTCNSSHFNKIPCQLFQSL